MALLIEEVVAWLVANPRPLSTAQFPDVQTLTSVEILKGVCIVLRRSADHNRTMSVALLRRIYVCIGFNHFHGVGMVYRDLCDRELWRRWTAPDEVVVGGDYVIRSVNVVLALKICFRSFIRPKTLRAAGIVR